MNCNKKWKVNDVLEYDMFCIDNHEKGITWASGRPMLDKAMRDAIIHNGFPAVVELDKGDDGVIHAFYCAFKEDNTKIPNYTCTVPEPTSKPVTQEEPISLLTDKFKLKTGVYFVDKSGKSKFYTLEDFIANIQALQKQAYKEMEFDIGDIVRITDDGQLYSSYYEWFEENNVPINIAARYAYENIESLPRNLFDFTIVAKGPHRDKTSFLYAISPVEQYRYYGKPPVYLIGEEGIKRKG